MITRIRIEAQGASAAEVEAILHAAAQAFDDEYGETSYGEQFISRDTNEPAGHTAFEGRLTIHPNVAHDAEQVAALARRGVPVTPPTWASGPITTEQVATPDGNRLDPHAYYG